jgi:hypothetical protein
MKGRATDGRVSHFMKAPLAVALLREQHGEANARKIALTEQRRAKRARSKRRFAFWSEVAAQIENGNCNNAADTRPAAAEGQIYTETVIEAAHQDSRQVAPWTRLSSPTKEVIDRQPSEGCPGP